MKKLWNQYSYAIVLIVLSIAASLVLSGEFEKSMDDKYITVTVMEGESLWQLSQKYAEKHDLSPQQFINWVEKTNKLDGSMIYAGDSLVIPVGKEEFFASGFASQ